MDSRFKLYKSSTFHARDSNCTSRDVLTLPRTSTWLSRDFGLSRELTYFEQAEQAFFNLVSFPFLITFQSKPVLMFKTVASYLQMFPISCLFVTQDSLTQGLHSAINN